MFVRWESVVGSHLGCRSSLVAVLLGQERLRRSRWYLHVRALLVVHPSIQCAPIIMRVSMWAACFVVGRAICLGGGIQHFIFSSMMLHHCRSALLKFLRFGN